MASRGAAASIEAFDKLFASVRDPQTQDNHARHLALAKNVLYQHESGWKLAELPTVNAFLTLLRDKVDDGAEQFAAPLLAALTLSAKKANEEILRPELLHGLLPTLGDLLASEDVEIQLAAAEALRQFASGALLARPTATKSSRATGDGDAQHPDDFRLSPRVFSQTLLEQTGTVEAVVNAMHDLFPDDEEDAQGASDSPGDADKAAANPVVDGATPRTGQDEASTASIDRRRREHKQQRLAALLFPLMELLVELSSHEGCAEALVVTGALHYVLFVLESVSSAQDELLPLCLLVLWNVLELSHEKVRRVTSCGSRKELLLRFRLRSALHFLGDDLALHALLHALELLLRHGYRQQDKAQRNAALMVLLLLAKRRANLNVFHRSGITNCLLSYATAAEHARSAPTGAEGSVAASGITASVHLYATSSAEDVEFKQALWFLVAEVAHGHAANMRELVQFRFLETLVAYATSSRLPSAALAYSAPQLQLLQATALSVLNHVVAPLAIDHAFELRAHESLVSFLRASPDGSDGVLAAAWLLLVQLAAPEPAFQTALGDCGAVEAAVAQFSAPPARHTHAARRHAVIACAAMCRGHARNRARFLDANGVHVLAEQLERHDASLAVLEEHLVVGVLEAVRSCIVGDARSEQAFVNADGVPRLLSVLVQAPKAVKHQALAALAELCVNPAAVPSFMDWRCDRPGALDNASALEVLLRVFADEEEADARHRSSLEAAATVQAEPTPGPRPVAASSVRQSAFQSVLTCSSPLLVSSGSDSASPERPASPAFARLKEALRAAQCLATPQALAGGESASSSVLTLSDAQIHPEVDLKAKVHAVLANVASACDPETLAPRDQVVLEVAKEYRSFRVGMRWQSAQLELQAEGVRPIYADALFLRLQVERAFNAAVCTKHAQQDVFSRARALDEEQEAALLRRVLLQKRQEEQAARFQRANRLQNSTLRLHFDAKKTRLEFMRRQDPAALAAVESDAHRRIDDPPPEYEDAEEAAQALALNERELRGRMSTIDAKRR